MAFRLPTFNLLCTITSPDVANTPAIPTLTPRLTSVPCQLTYGHRVNVSTTGGTSLAGIPILVMNVLLPAETDIRGPQDTFSFDVVEIPEGTGRWYWVAGVDDIGKGFSNEHRTASILALEASWVAPYL